MATRKINLGVRVLVTAWFELDETAFEFLHALGQSENSQEIIWGLPNRNPRKHIGSPSLV